MDRTVFFKFRDHLRCCVNGVPVLCKQCGKHARYEPGTQLELRHQCDEAPLPDVADDVNGPTWDDLDDIGDYEDPLVGDAFAFADDMSGYGNDPQAYTAFTRGSYDPGY